MSQEIPSYLSHMKVHFPYQTGSRYIVNRVSTTVPILCDKWVSCHHAMMLPQVTDGGTASNMDGSCEYIE